MFIINQKVTVIYIVVRNNKKGIKFIVYIGVFPLVLILPYWASVDDFFHYAQLLVKNKIYNWIVAE